MNHFLSCDQADTYSQHEAPLKLNPNPNSEKIEPTRSVTQHMMNPSIGSTIEIDEQRLNDKQAPRDKRDAREGGLLNNSINVRVKA